MLGRAGLATLDDPAGMCQQLGFLVEGHDHFRQLLNRCDPEHRRDMYEALKPHLRFEAKPLDVYISELGQIAEREQLPTIGPDGLFQPFHVAEIRTDLERAVDQAIAKWTLTVVCRKCTREAEFYGARKADCVQAARDAGWVLQIIGDTKFEICPECPGGQAD